MKVAVIYNRESQNVINLFGVPSREKYGQQNIKRITDALKKGGHQVTAFEGDKDLVRRIEEFMPRVIKGELPGMVFNLSYGIQGQARYTHVPGMLEMLGVPYVGSGPLAHSLALDKVVAKMMFRQHELPTPDFAVLNGPESPLPDLGYPLITKPKNESTSFGLAIVHDEDELRAAAGKIFDEFGQPVLVEQYIDGREINVGLLGNGPPDPLPAAELVFGDDGPPVYTMADKKGSSGREVGMRCPADLSKELEQQAQQLARRAFEVLGCADCARVDFRVDRDGQLFILELNSLPSLGARGSYVAGAAALGLDFVALVNRLVEVASARYFGTPRPLPLGQSKDGAERQERTFAYITARRDHMERRLREWTSTSSRSQDPIGLRSCMRELGTGLREIGLRQAAPRGDSQAFGLWETPAGFDDGTLLVAQLDVPIGLDDTSLTFRREPEWLYGEGIGVSRGPLVMIEYALRALKAHGGLAKLPLGVLAYADEGQDCRYSAEAVRAACRRPRRVLVLSPAMVGGKLVIGQRGLRKYRLVVEGQPRRPGQYLKSPEVLPWVCSRLVELNGLTDRKARIAVSPRDMRTHAFPMTLPHRVSLTLLVGYPTVERMDALEERIREHLGKRELRWQLEPIADRPPMPKRPANLRLAETLAQTAARWDITLETETSVSPSVAGFVPEGVSVVAGLGPSAQDVCTPSERIERISLVQRALVLAQYLVDRASKVPR